MLLRSLATSFTAVLAVVDGAASASQPLVLQPAAPVALSSGPKLFNVGLPRTGTTSLHECLTEWGLRSFHANDGTIDTIYPEAYEAFESGSPAPGVEELINGHDAFGDLPWFSLADVLLQRDANATFVATRRPVADWLPSFRNHVMKWVYSITTINNTVINSKSYAYFQAVFGDDIFTPTSYVDALAADTSALDALLTVRFEAHYEELQRAVDAANATLHILDLEEVETFPEKLRALISSSLPTDSLALPRSCAAYTGERLHLLLSRHHAAD